MSDSDEFQLPQLAPDLGELESLALAATSELTVAELHGAVCGMVATNVPDAPGKLLALLGVDAVQGETPLAEFAAASLLAMDAEALTFEPLTGSDDEDVTTRLENLAAFSASFLAGFGAGVGRIDDDLEPHVIELVRDLAAISQVETDPTLLATELGDHESGFVELHEFVRVAVVLIRAHGLAGTLRVSPDGDGDSAAAEPPGTVH